MWRKVAVTGGLSSGKSSVCRFFRKLGAYVLSADEIVHQLLSPDTVTGQQVLERFGNNLAVGRQINRSALAEKVFGKPEEIAALENILHPAVLEEIKRRFEQLPPSKETQAFVVEVPLLFEARMEEYFDLVIAVQSREELRKKRYQEMTERNENEFKRRNERQLPEEEKCQRAHLIIENNGTLENLHNQVAQVFHKLTKQPEGNS